jgi:hypothetical protein
MGGHPGTLDLRLYRGDSYAWTVRVWSDDAHTQPGDLTGVTAAGAVAGIAGGVIPLDCAITLPNIIEVELAASSWDGVLNPSRWDLQLTFADGRIYTLLAGGVSVQDDVTA